MNKVAGAAATVAGFEPFLTAFLPKKVLDSGVYQKIDKTFDGIVSALGTAEVMVTAINGPNAKSGGDKLKAAAPLIAQIIHSSEALAGKEIRDQAMHDKAILDLTSAAADLLNSY